MDEKQKELIIKKIVNISENLQDPLARGNRRRIFISRDGISYSLTDRCLDFWDDILRDLLIKQKWNTKFSEKYVESKLQEIISNLIRDRSTQKAHEYLDKLEKEYEHYSIEQVLCIPLFGIELDERLIELGNVTFKKLNNERTEELIAMLNQAISNSSNTDEEKKMHFDFEKELINEYLRDRVMRLRLRPQSLPKPCPINMWIKCVT